MMPGRFLNARKGDVILSPGGTGLIGGLLLSVTPSQWYSHSGITTRNYDEITHSTASEQRLIDHTRGQGGSDGFEPNALKYLWPGVITQQVESAIKGVRPSRTRRPDASTASRASVPTSSSSATTTAS
jgi:hypothetical protein